MKKMLIAIVATLLFVCVPALAGAQVLQITTSAENWPTLHSEWKEAGAATEDVVSANAVGVTAYRIAKSRQEPSSEMKQEDYLVAFYQANPELNPVDEWIKLDTFLTLARAGKIQHPPVPTATTAQSVAEVAAQPVETTAAPTASVAAPQESADEVARFTAEAALRASRDAVAIATRTSAEVEKLASRSGVDTVARGRLTALEQQSAALATLPQELSDRQEKLAAEQAAKQEVLQQRIDAEITNLKEEVEGWMAAVDAQVAEVVAAPAKADNVARTSAGIAVIMVVGLIVYLWFFRRNVNQSVTQLKEEQEDQHQQIEAMEIKVEVSYEKLHLKAKEGAVATVRVDGKEFQITLIGTDDPLQVKIQGIRDQTKPVRLDRLERVCRRAYQDPAGCRLLKPVHLGGPKAVPSVMKVAAAE